MMNGGFPHEGSEGDGDMRKWEKVKLGNFYDVHNGLSKGNKYN